MNRVKSAHAKQGSQVAHERASLDDRVLDSASTGNPLRLLSWLAAVTFIFAVLYQSSYFALLWSLPYQNVDMTSQLQADYGAWDFVVFQPVDPAIIEEIMQERDLPEQIVVDSSNLPTPAVTPSTPSPREQQPSSTPPPNTEVAPSLSVSETPYAESPEPTNNITVPEVTETPQPTVVAHPTRPRKTPKTPKPPKPDKPPKSN